MIVVTRTNHAQDYATSLLVTLRDVVSALTEGDEYEGQQADEYLMEWPLELVSRVGSPFEILLTFGGPDARIVWDGRYGPESARLVVSWWGDRFDTTSEDVRFVARYFADYMDNMAVTS